MALLRMHAAQQQHYYYVTGPFLNSVISALLYFFFVSSICFYSVTWLIYPPFMRYRIDPFTLFRPLRTSDENIMTENKYISYYVHDFRAHTQHTQMHE